MRKLNFLFIILVFASCQKEENVGLVDINDYLEEEEVETVDQTSMSQVQEDMLNALNAVRITGCNCAGTSMPAVDELMWHPMLEEASMQHAQDMDQNDYFSHSSQDGSSPSDRMEDVGYDWLFAGENLVSGVPSANAAVNAFLASAPHCKTLMNGNYSEIGVGNVGNLWVVKFGTRR